MKLTIPEFLEIRERQSQDDLKTLIAFVEHTLGVTPATAPPAPAASVSPAPQQEVTVTSAAAKAPPKRTRSSKKK